jgi:SPP1 family predicted phage head-tail adaptor
MIDPGQMNRRLTLEAPVESADGSGGVTRSFSAVATLWAQVTPVAADESVEAGALGATITHRIGIRFSPDVTLRHRFRDGARIFRIVAMRERGKRRFLDIDAQERTD